MICILFIDSLNTIAIILSDTLSVTYNPLKLKLRHFSLATLVFKSWKSGIQSKIISNIHITLATLYGLNSFLLSSNLLSWLIIW